MALQPLEQDPHEVNVLMLQELKAIHELLEDFMRHMDRFREDISHIRNEIRK